LWRMSGRGGRRLTGRVWGMLLRGSSMRWNRMLRARERRRWLLWGICLGMVLGGLRFCFDRRGDVVCVQIARSSIKRRERDITQPKNKLKWQKINHSIPNTPGNYANFGCLTILVSGPADETFELGSSRPEDLYNFAKSLTRLNHCATRDRFRQSEGKRLCLCRYLYVTSRCLSGLGLVFEVNRVLSLLLMYIVVSVSTWSADSW
jgi:hypothetical protein